MWSFVENGPSFVQFVVLVSCPVMGLSHIARPRMWVDFFNGLHAQGMRGVITRTFTFELWPAILIVSFHQVWHGPATVITIYGWLLTAKVALAMLVPETGLKSLALASKGPQSFIIGGCLLVGIGACAGSALFWPA